MRYTKVRLQQVKKNRQLWLLLMLCLIGLKAVTQPAAIMDSISIIATTSPPRQAIAQINLPALSFSKMPDNRINFGIVSDQYKYFVLKINGVAAPADQYLSIDNTSIDSISIFKINEDGTSQLLYQGGSLTAFDNNRKYIWHTAPVTAGAKNAYYMIALKAAQKIINVKYDILSSDGLQLKYQRYGRMVFLYVGAVSIIILIVMLAWVLFKQSVFAAYFGYIIFVACWIMLHYGYLFPYLYPHVPVINEIAKPVSSLLASYFLLIVLKKVFIHPLKTRPLLQQVTNWLIVVLPLLTISMGLLLFTFASSSNIKTMVVAAWHASLFFSNFIILLVPLCFIRTGFTAKLFSFAMLLACAMLFVQLLANSGLINNFFICEHGAAIGSLLESFIMAFGLFHNLLEEKKQKEKQVLVLQSEQTATLKKLITVQENERKRIAADLHDNIGPLLAALKINFRRLVHAKDADVQYELVAKTESIIDDSIAEIRNVAHNLMPKGLSANGLINTLTEYFDGIQQLYNKVIVFNHHIHAALYPDLQINVYRIICELVLNAAKHSNAGIITVKIKADENCVSFSINDDGKGFKPKAKNSTTSLGLQNTESRILYLKGKYSLITKPGKGTVIKMEIPLQLYEPQVNGF